MAKINKNNTYNTLSHWHKFRLKLMLEGIVVGIFAGFLVVFYRIILDDAEKLRTYFLNLNIEKGLLIPLWFLILIFLAYIVGILVKREPLISGSGIPQVKAQLLGKLEMNWVSIVIKKVIGGFISIGAGLSLGREGPSIQLGAAMGQGFSRIFKRLKIEEKYLITSGSSAGLAAAFNAPLAGVMFSLEEVHKHFSPLILLSALSASLTADFISSHFFGLKPVFSFENVGTLPLNSYGYIIVLGIIVGIFGVFYNFSLIKTQELYSKLKWIPVEFKHVIPFLVAGILAFTLPQVLGGGHGLIDALTEGSITMKMLMIVLLVKFVFSMISYGSGAPGGIFFPLLVLGALTGAIYGNVLVHFFNFSPEYINNFIILAMAGYFTAIVRAPITGSILITEMTGSFSHLLSLTIISLVAYVVADLLKSAPIYESLLERVLKSNGIYETVGDSKSKTVLEVPVCIDCEMDGKQIKDLKLPKDCLLVAIKRGEKEIIPRGDTVIYSGDCLNVLVNEDKAALTNQELLEMGRNLDEG
ncbi:H+/Cl-antiporter ClcA [Desulfonispora thiosulfatigenes DSM 11270]|uniref:H+/Cl-antiporter ClcA n=1 Tax=Desulfonispora thiosulfatigenes DSM 11270 TaxID=656914 RepID=A0A1W1UEA2_DESTI|nr:ClC family H(+)/Cl(-) exchange transporter [Desulfonispora thiosulfatigenes]SMB79131.1 H+/Cl-antiporter ClcA [Desulfonispora thiosulfatigenes DSM 11270]